MHSDAEEHFLRSLEQRAVEVVDDITFEHELQGGIGEKFVTLRVDETGAGVHLLLGVIFEDILAVKPAIGKIAQLGEKAVYPPLLLARGKLEVHVRHHETRGDELPFGRFLGGELDGGAHERRIARVFVRSFSCERGELACKIHQVILWLGEVRLDAFERGGELPFGEIFRDLGAVRPRLRAGVAVKDETLDFVEIALLHQGLFRKVLHLFDGGREGGDLGDDGVRESVELRVRHGMLHAAESGCESVLDLDGVELLLFAVSLGDEHSPS